MSNWGATSIGVPQGSILGPLHFIYPSVVNQCMLDLYADDAELHCSQSDLHVVEICLQSDLGSVATWLLDSHLGLNLLLEAVKEWQINH